MPKELDLPGLRCWPVKRYPYLVFYVERDDHIDVWRVLHGQRDIPAWLRESGCDNIRRACPGFELGLCRCRKLLRA